jgi:hypothetical protein
MVKIGAETLHNPPRPPPRPIQTLHASSTKPSKPSIPSTAALEAFLVPKRALEADRKAIFRKLFILIESYPVFLVV